MATYAILLYDVPTDRKDIYKEFRRSLKGVALRVNLSCYLIDWDMRDPINKLITKYCPPASVYIFPISDPNIANSMAQSAFSAFATRIVNRLLDMIDKKKTSKQISNYASKAIDEATSYATIFCLTNELEAFYKAIRKYVDATININIKHVPKYNSPVNQLSIF